MRATGRSGGSLLAHARILPGVERSFPSFPVAVQQVEDARVWGGIHFRAAVEVGASVGGEVADCVLRKCRGRPRVRFGWKVRMSMCAAG